MVHISQDFVNRVTERFFERPEEPFYYAAEIFRYWHDQQPEELERIANSVEVDINDLRSGNVVAAMKVLTERKDPMGMVEDFFRDPVTVARLAANKRISPEARAAFNAANLDELWKRTLGVDITRSSQDLVDSVEHIMRLYGFVTVESDWFARFQGRDVKADFKQFAKTSLALPYEDYKLVTKYARGLDEVVLVLHHASQKDARESTYHSRTLIGNCRLLDSLPVIAARNLRVRYSASKRDPLTMAFNDGFIVDLEDGKFAYHPRLLMEGLAHGLKDPAKLYFFRRIIFGDVAIPRHDFEQQALKGQIEQIKTQIGQAIPSRDRAKVGPVQEVALDFRIGNVRVDVHPYVELLNSENFKRLAGVKNLGNLMHLRIPYATQSRLEHSLGVMHIARVLCSRLGITGYDALKVELYALVHDAGHLTGSHATEDYFRARCGFDHEKFALDILREGWGSLEEVVKFEDIKAMFERRDALHKLVDGPFGADRIYYMSIDENEFGNEKNFDSLKILTWLRWVDQQVVVDQYVEPAFEFLDNRARLYEKLYFSPLTQIADAYQRKMLFAAGISSPFQKVKIRNNGSLDFVPEEGMDIEFWKFTDAMFQYTLSNHPDREVNEVMRHLLGVFHKAPHATVAALKISGQESAEPAVEIPVYPLLIYGYIKPCVEGVSPEALAGYHKAWQSPERQHELEKVIAERSGLPKRHIIVASVPNMQKLASEYAPVRLGQETKSLFDINPEYRKPFLERAARMACLRVAVHPQMYYFAREFFLKNSLAEIVAEVYK
jgi:hypothetical protein